MANEESSMERRNWAYDGTIGELIHHLRSTIEQFRDPPTRKLYKLTDEDFERMENAVEKSLRTLNSLPKDITLREAQLRGWSPYRKEINQIGVSHTEETN
jgi:hypothetical protein